MIRERTALLVAVSLHATAAVIFDSSAALAGPTVGDRPPLPRAGATTAVASEAAPAAQPAFGPSGLREAAPRPAADLRVQNRYARNAGTVTGLRVGAFAFCEYTTIP